jgi:hypothetical protein
MASHLMPGLLETPIGFGIRQRTSWKLQLVLIWHEVEKENPKA